MTAPKPRQINFRLPEADAERLDALAAAEHRSTPDYVRSVVLRLFEAPPNVITWTATVEHDKARRAAILADVEKRTERAIKDATRPRLSKKDAYLRERK